MPRHSSNRGPYRRRPKRRLFAEALESRRMLTGDVIPEDFILVGDQDHNDVVNSTDLGMLLNNYGATVNTTWERGDLNADSIVNREDLGLLLNNFRKDIATAAMCEEEPPAPVDDHVDEIGLDATAIDLLSGNWFVYGDTHGVLETPGDVDVFKFTWHESQPFAASITSDHFAGTIRMEIPDAFGSVLALTESEEVFAPVALQTFAPNSELHAGDYYLVVSSRDQAVGSYSINVQRGPVTDDHTNEIGPDATTIELSPLDNKLVGQAIGHHEINGDVDVFQFTSEAEQPFTALVYGWTKLELLDANGNALSAVEATSQFFPAEMQADLGVGLYYLHASRMNQSGTSYSFDVELGSDPPPADDHADIIGTDATVLEISLEDDALVGSALGVHEVHNDIDVFRFQMETGQTLTATFFHVFNIGSANMELLDANGDVLASIVADQTPMSVEFEYEAVAGGQYYLRATGLNAETDGPKEYLVAVRLESNDLSDDHADEIGVDATPLMFEERPYGLRAQPEGSIDTSEDVDVFQFTLGNARAVSGLLLPSSSWPVVMELQNENGQVIGDITGNFLGTVYNLPRYLDAGTYYLSFRSTASRARGTYSADLEIYFDDHPNQLGLNASSIELASTGDGSGSARGLLEASGDVDFFKFELDERARLTGILEGSGETIVNAELIDQGGNVIETFGVEGGQTPVEIDVQLSEGLFFLSVFGATTDTVGPYSVELRLGEFVPLPPSPGDDHADAIGPGATVIELHESDGVGIGSAEGAFHAPNDIDVFQFTIESEEHVFAAIHTTLPGLTIELVNSDEAVLVSVPVILGYRSIDSIFPAGTYYLRIEGNVGESFLKPGTHYQIELQSGESPPSNVVDDHADETNRDATHLTFFQHFPGSFQSSFGGRIETDGDVDVFQFTVQSAFSVRFKASVATDLITGELLSAETGQVVASSDLPARSTFDINTVILPGTYYLRISVDAQVPFFGSLNLTNNPNDDHSDTISDATRIVLLDQPGVNRKGEGRGFIGNESDVDVFQFELDDAKPVEISVGEFGPNTTLALADAEGMIIETINAEDTTTILQPELAAGTYFITVSASIGAFQFDITAGPVVLGIDDHADEIGEDASVLQLSSSIARFGEGTLDTPEDIDVFQFETSSTTRIEFGDIPILEGVALELLAEDGEVLQALSSGGSTSIQIEAGLYYVRVSASDPGVTGSYFFFVNGDLLTEQ